VEVNRQLVASIGDGKDKIKQSEDKDHLLLLVQRENGTFFVPLEQQR
jgi:DNA replication protein DnaD